ncbi:hypothetical protein FOA52_003326 [Chlamydomonas sp. UWO 241]|nr:hypothetical protein FOA52_003326 [Chlamydomonas sp. UWO 241]
MAKDCFKCVFDPNVYNPWGCNHCYEASFPDGVTNLTVATAFTKCVTDNPYEDKVGSYNWACAECAAIEDLSVRALCIAYIMTPAVDAGYDANAATNLDTDAYGKYVSDYAAKLGNAEWVSNASETVCFCIDMAKASTWDAGTLANWYTSACPECTAQQRSCYEIRNISYSVEKPGPGIDVSEELADNIVNNVNIGEKTFQQHLDFSLAVEIAELAKSTSSAKVNTGNKCAQCMRDFKTPTTALIPASVYAGSEDSMYACEQFCMNPDAIANLQQQAQCFGWLDKFRATGEKNVAPCGLCMTAITPDVVGTAGEAVVGA